MRLARGFERELLVSTVLMRCCLCFCCRVPVSSLSVSGFPQVLFPNQLSPPLTLTFNGRLPADAQVSVNPSWGWMGSSRSTSSINLAASSSNSIVQRRGDTVAFQTFSSGLGVQTSASMDFSVSVKGVLSGLPVSDMSSVSMPSIQLAPSVPSFASLAQSSPGVLGSRQGFGLVVDPVADKIFVIGGYNRDSSAQINSVYMSQDAASWTLMAAPSFTPRESFCSLVFPPAAGATNSIIVIMGGLGSGGPLQDAHRTTDGGGECTRSCRGRCMLLLPLTSPRTLSCCVVCAVQ